MSVEAMTWAWRVRRISSTQKLVLVVLSNWMDPRGRGSVTIVKLMELTGLCDRSVRRALSALEAKGLIERTRQRTATGALDGYDYALCIEEAA